MHEQSRGDRDNYVKVFFQNIRAGQEHNFNKYVNNELSSYGQPYDYESIMHYGWRDFSANGEATILPANPSIDKLRLGQRNGLSPIDITKVKKHYSFGQRE